VEKPPVTEFVSIETHQDLERGLTELKMPSHWFKALGGVKDFFPKGPAERDMPISERDEKLLGVDATVDDVAKAKHLPFCQLLGVMSHGASSCKFEMKHAVSKLGSRRNGWSEKHFECLLRTFERGHHTREIGLMFSKGLDPHGDNAMCACADASLAVPRPQGCSIVMMNGCCILFKTKKHVLTAVSSRAAELTEFYLCAVCIKGLRNMVFELGIPQKRATLVFQDDESAAKIVNNRGSLGITSRAMDLRTLSYRNAVEDHQVETEGKRTNLMMADVGTKALPKFPFCMFRDAMNGYALVRAARPDLEMSPLLHSGDGSKANESLKQAQREVVRITTADMSMEKRVNLVISQLKSNSSSSA
jgi:hypothetical protein